MANASLDAIYRDGYRSLVRSALLILGSAEDAEDVVQEAFVRMFRAAKLPDDPPGAMAYVRKTVVNLSRSRLRRLRVERRYRHFVAVPDATANPAQLVDAEIITMLSLLGRRSREAIVLRHYLGLSEQETAEAMGVSVGSVKGYASRGLAELRTRLAASS